MAKIRQIKIRPLGRVASTADSKTPKVYRVRTVTPHVHGILNRSVLHRRLTTPGRHALRRIPTADAKAKRIVECLVKYPEKALSATAIARLTGIPRREVPVVLSGLDLEIRRGKRTLYAADPERFRPQQTKTYVVVHSKRD